MILLKELYLNLRDQSQQVAATEQPTAAEKKITELKGKQWVQDKVRPLVL